MTEKMPAMVAGAIRAERQRCMADVCEGCREGWQLGGHRLRDRRQKCHFNPETKEMHFCDAWPIRARGQEDSGARIEGQEDERRSPVQNGSHGSGMIDD